MHPGPITRRAVLPILAAPSAAVALSVAAPAETKPDPVFALIETHRMAYAEFGKACDLMAREVCALPDALHTRPKFTLLRKVGTMGPFGY